jgi:hypothetical protein
MGLERAKRQRGKTEAPRSENLQRDTGSVLLLEGYIGLLSHTHCLTQKASLSPRPHALGA